MKSMATGNHGFTRLFRTDSKIFHKEKELKTLEKLR